MKTVNVFRAQDMPGAVVEPTEIAIGYHHAFPDDLDQDGGDALHSRDAQMIANALYGSLPGGTFDRLVAKLLILTASRLHVPRGRPDSKKPT